MTTTTARPADRPALRAVRAVAPLTAHEAISWFAAAGRGGIIGYALAADRAVWLRVDETGVAGTADGQPVDGAVYELVLFDGSRELRWVMGEPPRGRAVALAEDPAALPAGEDVSHDPPPRRAPEMAQRILAGTPHPHPAARGWTTLRSPRYRAADLPVEVQPGAIVVLQSVEYHVEDGEGNVDVADSRLVALTGVDRDSLRPPPPPPRPRPLPASTTRRTDRA
jgi:hypothetical protein